MTDTVPDSNYQSQHHFISEPPWKDRPVRATNAGLLNQLLGGTPYTGLLIDETAFAKKGTDSVGVSRQWNGQLGKRDNCQVAVFSALCDSHHASLLDARLYLPKTWTDDQERCRKAGIPENERVFKPKTQLALDLIDEADAFGVDYSWVGVDAGYGKDPAFLRALVERGKTFFADVHKTQHIYTTQPTKRRPLPGSKGPQKKLSVMPKAMEVKDWVAAQPMRKWKKVKLRNGSHGKQVAKILHGHVWVWDKKEEKAHAWHLIVRRRGKADDKYTLSNAPADIPTKAMAWYQGQRFKVEQSFQEAKQELGMDDYQVRGWRAWHHHVTITLMAMNFLLDAKLRLGHEYPGLSLRGVRELFVAQLPRCDFKTVLEQVARRAHQQHRAREGPSPAK
jgi:SRSO17 transposase